ncbi:MAG: MoxR family ATPase [Candidatus Dormibacteraeota bacterium]|nr:MoxR family ATPase [Candidatus Dormibacteraeota bacterium]
MTFPSVDAVGEALIRHNYVADTSLAMAIFLSCGLPRPLLVEGEAGVGKTEIAKVLAAALDTRLIRLQCYEGIDVRQAVYEWNYSKQMLRIRSLEQGAGAGDDAFNSIFGSEYLIRRPLLQAIEASANERPPVLLIDEIDRADEEFEAFLLELLSDYQVTIPELGTLRAEKAPVVVLTSNRTREIHDALKRRCLYYWIPYPNLAKEARIVMVKLPHVPERLATQVCTVIQDLRRMDLLKVPGIAETLDWVGALTMLGRDRLDLDVARDTLGVVIKMQEDLDRVQDDLPDLVGRAEAG